ncbi:Rpn family recombination-promoting nuclease/putative transposase [Clostridium sp. FP1]|nr:Rpn family recombination-promoting nuclease/putative transposase [Clostridium sp. FP1]
MNRNRHFHAKECFQGLEPYEGKLSSTVLRRESGSNSTYLVSKKTFGEEETKDNLIALLNAILSKKDRDKLVTLEIVGNKGLTPELIGDKTGIIDVRAKTEDGTQLEIEV